MRVVSHEPMRCISKHRQWIKNKLTNINASFVWPDPQNTRIKGMEKKKFPEDFSLRISLTFWIEAGALVGGVGSEVMPALTIVYTSIQRRIVYEKLLASPFPPMVPRANTKQQNGSHRKGGRELDRKLWLLLSRQADRQSGGRADAISHQCN